MKKKFYFNKCRMKMLKIKLKIKEMGYIKYQYFLIDL